MSQTETVSCKPNNVPTLFQFQNNPIRTQLDGEVLWFAAMDVCTALGILWKPGKGAGNSGTLAAIPTEWQGMRNFRTPGGRQSLKCVTEPAVYKLAFRSNKPEADAFTNWIASEVVPSIRKTGKYEAKIEPASGELLPSHQAQLKAIVDAKVGMLPSEVQRKAYAEIWSRFSRHFQIARYQQLPSERVGEAITYLVEMQIKGLKLLSQSKESKALPTFGAMPIEFEPPCPMPVEDDISQVFKRARAVTEYLKALKLQIHVPCRVQAANLSFLNNRNEIELYKALDKQIDYSLCSLDSATCALESAWHLSKFMQEERKPIRP